MTNENTDQKKSSEYQTNYDTLKATADKLKEAENAIDIDALLEEVESAMKAYEFCKNRILRKRHALAHLCQCNGSRCRQSDSFIGWPK